MSGIDNLFSLEGKVILVTGGSRGIGKMIAQGFLTANAAKVYVASKRQHTCEPSAKELCEVAHGECIPLTADISTVDGCRKLAEQMMQHESHLDVLVNSAGINVIKGFDSFTEEDWDSVMDVNLKGAFFLTQQMVPLLRKSSGPAKVINISSIDGSCPAPYESYSYIASKAGLMQLTAAMARRLVSDNILVNCIAPIAFPTDMNKAAQKHPDILSKHIPAGRVGKAEDIAGPCIMLASKAGDYIVGITLPVDGGVSNCGEPVWHKSTADCGCCCCGCSCQHCCCGPECDCHCSSCGCGSSST